MFFWSKKDFTYLDVKLKFIKKDNNIDFRLVQNPTRGETDFNQFMRLRNHLVNAAENLASEENISPVLLLKMSKDMDEQFKLACQILKNLIPRKKFLA